MSKGNMLLGYTRGSVGDVVFSRVKGQQIAKARNRNPNNPKTIQQMLQRSLFISSVKFYQLARRQFFRFAYEDRKINESDFNAFMRHNTANGTNMSRSSFQAYNYPALGDFQLSQGSLTPFNVFANENTFYAYTGIIASDDPGVPTIVAALSALLLRNPRYQPGDMITFVDYGFRTIGEEIPPKIEVNNDNYNTWFDFKQFKIDTEDNTALSNFGISCEIGEVDKQVKIRSTGEIFDESYRGCALILSRQTSNGLLVSDSRFVFSALYQEALAAAKEDTFVNNVISSWGASEEAILSPRSVV